MKTRLFLALASFLGLALLSQPMPSLATSPCADPLGCVTIGPSDQIHIAYALVLSGPNSTLGTGERNGVQIAIDDSGGKILGHTIKFDGVDSGCTSAGGLAAANTLVADPSIVGIIGPSCSAEARAAMPVLSPAGFLLVSPSNTAPDLTEPGNPNNYPGYLRTAYNDKVQGMVTADYAYKQLGVRRAATINDGSIYANSLQQTFATEFSQLGGTITAQATITPQQTSMSTVLTSIASGSPDLLYLPVFMPAGGYIISQTKTTTGLQSAFLMGADALFTPDLLTAVGANVEGFMATSPDFSQFTAGYFDSFLPAYKAKFGNPTSPFVAQAYDAFMLVKYAIQRAAVLYPDGSLQIGRQALRNAMYATRNFPGLTGYLTCSATGDCGAAPISVYQFHTGQFPTKPIWPMDNGTASPGSGGTVTSYQGDTALQIPPGAITSTIVITYRLAYGSTPGGNLISIDRGYEVTAVYSDTAQQAQLSPGHTYTVTVQYTDAEIGPAIESTLALYWWDGSQWVREPSSVVDTVNNILTATPNHFSLWSVLGSTLRSYIPFILKNY